MAFSISTTFQNFPNPVWTFSDTTNSKKMIKELKSPEEFAQLLRTALGEHTFGHMQYTVGKI